MDLEKLEYYEFLDLTDIDEHERQQLKQTLFAEGTLDFLQLPWTNQKTESTYGSEVTPLTNGPPNPPSSSQDELVVHDRGGAPVAPPQLPPQSVTIYSSPAIPAYTMPPPNTPYQHPFVTNVSTSMHPVMPTHYIPQHYPIQEPTEISGRGHRGRGRPRGGKRADIRMENNMVETNNPQFSPAYAVPTMYYASYYTQPMGSPIQHPNPAHAPGSSVYVSMYPNVYGAYHAPGPQYYPPPTHVNAVMEDIPPDMAELNIEHNNPDETVYQQQINEDYNNTSQNVMSAVIVNSNIDTSDVNKSNFINNNVKIDTENNNIKTVPQLVTTKQPVTNAVNIQNDAAPISNSNNKISANVNDKNNEVIHNSVNVNQIEQIESNDSVSTKAQTVTCVSPVPHVNIKYNTSQSLLTLESSPKTIVSCTKVPTPPIVTVAAQEINQTATSTVMTPTVTAPLVIPPPAVTIPMQPVSKSWASLFSNNKTCSTIVNNISDTSKSPAKSELITTTESVKIEEEKIHTKTIVVNQNFEQRTVQKKTAMYSNDPGSHRMGEFLVKYSLDNRTVSLQPRGLTNRSNYCYINSILQALLACPPFYNLLKALPHPMRKNITGKSPTPIIDSMVDFVNEFIPLSAGARLNRKEKSQRKDENPDVPCGQAFEPAWIYKILNGIRSDTFTVEGRQEDAEEFFSCLLNGLNDEMLELMKLAEGDNQNNNKNLSNGDIVSNGDPNDQDEDEWKVMGHKNKGSIIRRAEFERSPISDIFRGQLRSRVHRANSRAQDQVTDNVQPFFTLQLDIEKANSVIEALEALVHKDKLEGVTCSKTNQQVEAWQQVTVEELPLVMVLHLKCFNYKLDACSKIIKTVEFPIDLKIDSKLLSTKIKYTGKQKQYKLFAVVYHDGKEATKGHYLTDAFHVGYGGWVRYDDSTVKSVTEQHVLHPSAARVPYLLFYRRCDTIGNQNTNNNNNNNNKKD